MSQQEIVLLGHGSDDPEGLDDFKEFAEKLSEYIQQPVRIAFLELSTPGMHSVFEEAAIGAGSNGEVLVLPMFLGAAYHLKAEISQAIQQTREKFPNASIKYSTPLGFHRKLAELLKSRVDETLAETPQALPVEESTVLVVGGGSSDADSNSSVSKTGRVLYEIGGYAGVEVAYQRVTRPNTAEGVKRSFQLNTKQIIVAPYLLFRGTVHKNMLKAANLVAQELDIELIHTRCLGPEHPLLVEVAAQRLREAAEGTSELLRLKKVEGFPYVKEDFESE